MFKKVSILITLLVCLVTITGCNCKKKPVVSIESISIVESSVPTSILVDELNDKLTSILINVNRSDGDTEQVNLALSMISSEDLAKLSNAGTHTVTVNFNDVTTTLNLVIEDNSYIVKVMYPDNSPVTSGVAVQWCSGNNCFVPVLVNSNGIARNNLKDNDYFIHIEGIPAGYTYDPNGYTASAENKYVEIKLIELSNITSGDGSKASPYEVSVGTYNVSFDTASTAGMKYFSFTTTEAGTYNLESLSTEKLAINAVDPYLGFLSTNLDGTPTTDGNFDSKVNINFSLNFEAEANTTYYFIIMISSATIFPATLDFSITKN